MVDVQPPAKEIKRNRLDKNDMIAVTTKKGTISVPTYYSAQCSFTLLRASLGFVCAAWERDSTKRFKGQ